MNGHPERFFRVKSGRVKSGREKGTVTFSPGRTFTTRPGETRPIPKQESAQAGAPHEGNGTVYPS